MTIKSKVPTDKYRDEWDRIFGKFKERHPDQPEQSTTVPLDDYDVSDIYKNDQGH